MAPWACRWLAETSSGNVWNPKDSAAWLQVVIPLEQHTWSMGVGRSEQWWAG